MTRVARCCCGSLQAEAVADPAFASERTVLAPPMFATDRREENSAYISVPLAARPYIGLQTFGPISSA